MKRKIVLILIGIIFTSCLFAQTTKFEYSYDAAGNRTKRVVIIFNHKNAQVDTVFNKEEEGLSVAIFPNPVSETLNLEFFGDMTESKIGYEVFTNSGQLIEKEEVVSNVSAIDFSRLAVGMYVLRLKINDKYKEYKIVKQS